MDQFIRRANQSAAGRAFTLIELLVVVSIIALLISVLLPSLREAREAARGVACMSNLRQVGIAFNMYAQDNTLHMPGVWFNTPTPDWPGTTPLRQWWTHHSAGGYLSKHMSPISARQIYNCPTNPSAPHGIDYCYNTSIQFRRIIDFRQDRAFLTENRQWPGYPGSGNPPLTPNDAWKIGYNTSFATFWPFVGYWHPGPIDPDSYLTEYPGGQANGLSMDGRVDLLTSEKLKQRSQP